MVNYEKNSFLAGIAVGKQLKGWAIGNSGGQPPTNVIFEALNVTSPPTKTQYFVGDNFDATGMVVSGTWKIENNEVVVPLSNYRCSPSVFQSAEEIEQNVNVSYTSDGTTRTATTPVIVGWGVGDMRVWVSSANTILSCVYNNTTKSNLLSCKTVHNQWDYIAKKLYVNNYTHYTLSFDISSPTGFPVASYSATEPGKEYFYILSQSPETMQDPNDEPSAIISKADYHAVGSNAGQTYHFDVSFSVGNISEIWLSFGMGNIVDNTSFSLDVSNIELISAPAQTVTFTWMLDQNTVFGTTNCLAGDPVIYPASNPPSSAGNVFVGWNNVPEYATENTIIYANFANITLLEYIESSGTQYIDTGISGDSCYYFKLIVSGFMSFTNAYASLIAARLDNFTIGRYKNDYTAYCRWRGQELTTQSISTGTDINTFELSSGKLTINNYIYNNASLGQYPVDTTSDNITILAAVSTSDKRYAACRLYGCKLFDANHNLLRDMVPCQANGENGMYDFVSNAFFANAGTGQFLGGPEK